MNSVSGKHPGSATFVLHALCALGALIVLNFLIATKVPVAVSDIESSYLLFFYHFPSAFLMFLFFAGVFGFSIAYLTTKNTAWDRHARISGEIGLLGCTITVVTGSIWGSMAWNQWWVWEDKRLMFAAIMWLTYAGYVTMHTQLEDSDRRRRFAAVFGIVAFINVPLVKYAIDWFGEVSHPEQFQDMSSNDWVRWTRWYGVLAFLLFYLLLYRWKKARLEVREQYDELLGAARRLEEGAAA